MQVEANKHLIRRHFEDLVNHKNRAVLETDVAPDFVDHNPAPGMAPGIAGLRDWFDRIFVACPDLQVSIEDLVGEGDRVALRLIWRGTHTGPLFGLEATGRKFEYASMVFFRIANSMLRERWSTVDLLTLQRQIMG